MPDKLENVSSGKRASEGKDLEAGNLKGSTTKFNPLALPTLAETMVAELLKQHVNPLSTVPAFAGPGIYAIYYTGSFEPYAPVAAENRGDKWNWPIYVGKAQFERLNQHAVSIRQVNNLNLRDFWCRYLVTEEIFIPLCESLLIKRYAPVWNKVVKGFGPKVVGKERTTQQISMWDLLHPGRPGRGVAPNRTFASAKDVLAELKAYYQQRLKNFPVSAGKPPAQG